MAHIHLPDGTFSLQWVLIWWGVAIVLIAIALRSARSYFIIILLLIASYYVSFTGDG
jgi:ABC-type Co2+ transport system permease subunit